MSNRGWQDGGREDRKNGVLELWSHWRKNGSGVSGDVESVAGPKADALRGTHRNHGYTESGGDGKRRIVRRRFTSLSGLEAGEWTGFYHLGTGSSRLEPDNSTQVVDFPHICSVSILWGSPEMGGHERNTDGSGERRVINFEFTRKPGKTGIPLPKPEPFAKTDCMTSLTNFTRTGFCPVARGGEKSWRFHF